MRADLKRGFLFSMMRRDRREERNKGMSLLFAGFQGRFATMLASESEGTEAVTHLPFVSTFLGAYAWCSPSPSLLIHMQPPSDRGHAPSIQTQLDDLISRCRRPRCTPWD